MRNTTTTVVIAAGAVLAAVIVTGTPAQQEDNFIGACCLLNGSCIPVSELDCAKLNGTYQGGGVGCGEIACPPQAVPPTVVATSVTGSISDFSPDTRYRIFRTWSDGQVDASWVKFEAGGSYCSVADACGPVVLIPGTCTTDVDRDGDTGINDFLTLLGGWGACR